MLANNLQLRPYLIKRNFVFFILFVFMLLEASAYASTNRIDGPTYSLPHVMHMNDAPTPFTSTRINALAKEAEQASQAAVPKAGFKPLITKPLTLCHDFHARHVNIKHLSKPLFVIGDDAESFTWLAKYKSILDEIQAVGLIVHANSTDALKRIRSAAGNLMLYPANGRGLNKRFGITCYPVLITAHLIEH